MTELNSASGRGQPGPKAIYPDLEGRTVLNCGGATSSAAQAGDRFEIEAADFNLTLRNLLQVEEAHDAEVQLL